MAYKRSELSITINKTVKVNFVQASRHFLKFFFTLFASCNRAKLFKAQLKTMSCCEGLRFHCPVLKRAERDVLHILSFSRDAAGLKQESLKRLGIKGPEAPETERECDATHKLSHQNKIWQKCHRLLLISLKSIWKQWK